MTASHPRSPLCSEMLWRGGVGTQRQPSQRWGPAPPWQAHIEYWGQSRPVPPWSPLSLGRAWRGCVGGLRHNQVESGQVPPTLSPCEPPERQRHNHYAPPPPKKKSNTKLWFEPEFLIGITTQGKLSHSPSFYRSESCDLAHIGSNPRFCVTTKKHELIMCTLDYCK